MKTLLVQRSSAVPQKLRDIVRAGSTEVKEIRADEERDASTLEADRVLFWNDGEIELSEAAGPQDTITRLRWPQDEDKLRLFFQTSG